MMTDNGSCYRSKLHSLACLGLGLRHLRTQPYRPRTNGKAERFIRTLINGWNDTGFYANSAERAAALPGWLAYYNTQQPHRSLANKPPLTRLHDLNNVASAYT